MYKRLLLFSCAFILSFSLIAQTKDPFKRQDRIFSTHNVICEDYGCKDNSPKTKLDIQLGDSEDYVVNHLKSLNIKKIVSDQKGYADRKGDYRILSLDDDRLGRLTLLFSKKVLVYFSINANHYGSNALDQKALSQHKDITIINDGDDLFQCFCGTDYALAFQGAFAILYHREGQIRCPVYHFFYIEAVQMWMDYEDKNSNIFDPLFSELRCVRSKKAEAIYIELTFCTG